MFIEKLGLNRDELSNKVAIISGAGRGIGKELARALAWLGAKVVIAEINSNGKDVEQLIISEGGEASFIQTDVSKDDDILNLEKKVIDKYGKVDILVNNAIVYEAGSILELPMEAWDKAYNINIRGAVLLIKTFLPYMLKQDNGVIVNVTSAGGTPYMAPYFASKTALTSIAESLAAELDETNISVYIFAPGMVDTPGIREATTLLAPRFGMTEEQFQNQDVNPGYEGLMPADHCAAGWAYTILHAKDYHGQIADPFGPLMKLSLISQKKSKIKEDQKEISKEERILLIKNTKNDLETVKAILYSVKKGTEDLGSFARKWVNKSFAKRCGMSIEKFMETIEDLKKGLNDPNLNFIWYLNSLNKLANYFKKNVEEAKGWIKDPDELAQTIETLHYRENSVRLLIDKLEELESIK